MTLTILYPRERVRRCRIASGPANCSSGSRSDRPWSCTAVSLAAGLGTCAFTSATTRSCASYANTATLAATNASPLTANASTTVLCPANIPTLSPAILAVLMLLLGAAAMITVKRR